MPRNPSFCCFSDDLKLCIRFYHIFLFSDHYCAQHGSGALPGTWGNGVSLGEGGVGGSGPPGSEEDKQSVLSEGRNNMEKEEEEWASRV
jgi:hypothetical protein